jgi:hypothetical protein
MDIIHLLSKTKDSETGFCLHPEKEYLYLLGPAELLPLEDGDRIQSPKRIFNERQDYG